MNAKHLHSCVWALLLYPLLWGCSQEPLPPQPRAEKPTVTVQFATNGISSKAFVVQEDLVSNVNLLAYYSNGDLAESAYYTTPAAYYLFEFPEHGAYTLYAIANAGRAMAPPTQEELLGLTYLIDAPQDLANSQGALIMTGEAYVANTLLEDQITISMKRCVGRVEFILEPHNRIDVLFQPTKVSLKNVARRVSYFGSSAAASSSEVFATGDTRNENQLNGILTTGICFYAFENMQGTLLPQNTQPHLKSLEPTHPYYGRCTYLEVEGNYVSRYYRGVVRYRIYLGANALTNFDFERNTNYRVTLILTGEGVDEVSWRIDTSELLHRPTRLIVTPEEYLFTSLANSYTLQTTFLPATTSPLYKGVTWRSDFSSVASVSAAGVVTPLKHGRTNVIATSTDQNLLRDTCVVSVITQPLDLGGDREIFYNMRSTYDEEYTTYFDVPYLKDMWDIGIGVEWEMDPPGCMKLEHYQESFSLSTAQTGTLTLRVWDKYYPQNSDQITITSQEAYATFRDGEDITISRSLGDVSFYYDTYPEWAYLHWSSDNESIVKAIPSYASQHYAIIKPQQEGTTYITGYFGQMNYRIRVTVTP